MLELLPTVQLDSDYNSSVSEFGDSSDEYKNTMSLTIHSSQPEYLISFSLSLHPIASNPLALVHHTMSHPEFIIDIRVAPRKRRRPVTFRLHN